MYCGRRLSVCQFVPLRASSLRLLNDLFTGVDSLHPVSSALAPLVSGANASSVCDRVPRWWMRPLI